MEMERVIVFLQPLHWCSWLEEYCTTGSSVLHSFLSMNLVKLPSCIPFLMKLSCLESLGLNVVSVVSDQGSNVLKLLANLGVSPCHPYFELRGKQYVTIFDPPHLKSVRNNLMKYDFELEGKVASWQVIRLFHDKDQKLPIGVSPKITEKHINPNGFSKMKVKLAAQVCSHSVAAGLSTYVALHALQGSALGTTQFVNKMDTITKSSVTLISSAS